MNIFSYIRIYKVLYNIKIYESNCDNFEFNHFYLWLAVINHLSNLFNRVNGTRFCFHVFEFKINSGKFSSYNIKKDFIWCIYWTKISSSDIRKFILLNEVKNSKYDDCNPDFEQFAMRREIEIAFGLHKYLY